MRGLHTFILLAFVVGIFAVAGHADNADVLTSVGFVGRISNDYRVCLGETVTFTASGSPQCDGAQFIWTNLFVHTGPTYHYTFTNSGTMSARVTYDTGTNYGKSSKSILVKSIETDIGVDANLDGYINEWDDPNELTIGTVIGLNNDDDNGNAQPDYLDAGEGYTEYDVHPVRLAIEPSVLGRWRWGDLSNIVIEVASGDEDSIRIWLDRQRLQEVISPCEIGTLSDVYSLPSTLYIEGVEVSSGARDVNLRFYYRADTADCDDFVAVTVAEADLDVDSNYDGVISDADDPDESKGAGLILEINDDNDNGDDDNNDGIVNGHDRDRDDDTWDDDASDLQQLVLRLNPTGLPSEHKVQLTVSNPNIVRVFDDSQTPVAILGPTAGVTWEKELSEMDLPDKDIIFHVEGVNRGSVAVTMNYLSEYDVVIHSDTVRLTVLSVDLDIDSDNNNGIQAPRRTEYEESLEEAPDKPGKILSVNDSDVDNDGVPNFADGFDEWGNEGANAGGAFIPMVVEIAHPIELSEAAVRFTYSESDPDGVMQTGQGTPAEPHIYTPAGGHLRIWKANGSTDRKKASADAGGHFVNSGIAYDPADLGGGSTITLYIEGIDKSTAIADQQILVEVDPDGLGPAGWVTKDAVRCTVIHLDLDIDSDNDDAFNAPEEDANEDHREDIQGNNARPGKFVEINHDDDDRDCIPDFADGFNRDGTNGNVDDSCDQESFTPLVLKIEEPIDLAKAKLKITYSASDPALTTRIGSEPLHSWEPSTGKLRIWKKDGDEARNKNSARAATDPGDYVPAGTYEDVSTLGFSGSTREKTLYIETVAPGVSAADEQIKVELDADGDGADEWMCLDAVRVTSVRADIDVDSDNNDAVEECDDPIEAEEPGCILPKDLEGDGPGEDCLKEIALEIEPVLNAGVVTLSAGAGIAIWTDASKTTQVNLPMDYDPPSTLPATLYLDGVTRGSKPDIELEYRDDNGLEIATDKTKALVVETPSWAPAKADVAYVWSSLPHLDDTDGEVFDDEITDQGYEVHWYEDDTDWGDTDFRGCTLGAYKNMPNCGILTVISHGGPGCHYAVYAPDTTAGEAAIRAWIGNESDIDAEQWPGSCWTARVSANWLASHWGPVLNANRAITLWSICYSASSNPSTGEVPVKLGAGGRWRGGYLDQTSSVEASAVNERFFRRMNGTTESAERRTAGEAYDNGSVYTSNLRMDGNEWTTLCPSPAVENDVFPSSSSGDRYGWGCIIFDTYMDSTVLAADALLQVNGNTTYNYRWIDNPYGAVLLGFDFDQTSGGSAEMQAIGHECGSVDGRPLDANRVTPAATAGNPENREWSF